MTPFGRRKMAHSNAGQESGLFQLSRTKGKTLELEWEFGKEPNALFQLHRDVNAPTADQNGRRQNGVSSVAAPSTPRPFANGRSKAEQPSAKHNSPFAPPPDYDNLHYKNQQSAAVEGEILPPTDPSPINGTAPRPADQSAAWNSGAEPFSSTANSVAFVPQSANQRTSGWNDQSTQRSRPSSAHSQLASLFSGEEGTRRVLTTRMALDDALDRWWTHSELAPLALLRDGLLVLEAGHDLDETQRSFLLRTALRTGRGMITALHYQLDADRTAFLLKEALLDTKHQFDPHLINALRLEDAQSEEWADYLEHDLAYEATVASGKRSLLAAAALHAMQQPLSPIAATALQNPVANQSEPAARRGLLTAVRPALFAPNGNFALGQASAIAPLPQQLLPLSHRWSLRWLLWACLMGLLLLSYNWSQFHIASSMISIPAGTYLVSDPTSSNPATSGRFQSVTLSAYRIDHREVSNADYRRCWEQAICPIPTSFDSLTRPGYFANRSYDDFPVINVTWRAAQRYCEWTGKRLPTLDEWEVAAGLAPATGRRFIYPWGDRFDPRLTNGGANNFDDTQLGDTQAGGTYHPAGSTSSGIMDMAGNVAEWTSMPAASMIDGVVVKGGSFLDGPDQLRNDALLDFQEETAAPWLGFRCAADE